MTERLDWNAKTIAEFRANQGRVGGVFQGAPMVLVHHRGRTSGQEYVTPTMYLPHDTEPDSIYVFATKGGAATNPDWYHNLTAAGDGILERRTETYKVTVRELTGAERDRVYAEQARRYPGFAEYERQNRWSPHHTCARTQAGVTHTLFQAPSNRPVPILGRFLALAVVSTASREHHPYSRRHRSAVRYGGGGQLGGS